VNVPQLAILPGFGPGILNRTYHTVSAMLEDPAPSDFIVQPMILTKGDHKRVAVISRAGIHRTIVLLSYRFILALTGEEPVFIEGLS
jgi:hypothetical protein